jgi:hypothetical protein
VLPETITQRLIGKLRRMRVASPLGIITLALLVVGVVSNTMARHLIQICPVVLAMMFSLFRSRGSHWHALPIFVSWFIIMSLIWLYLLGISDIVTGHFTPTEVAMTIVIGIACLYGIWEAIAVRSATPAAMNVLVFIAFAGMQVLALWLSRGN